MPLDKRKEFVGRVESDRMEKTVVVRCERKCKDPLYGKVLTKYSRFMADNLGNKAKVGNVVRIVETRPLSKNKRWRVIEIVGDNK